jgi:malonate-semialdehyde dehydrogenase (acetylating) / methylmalonate-semialdehyde dehydrogenase
VISTREEQRYLSIMAPYKGSLGGLHRQALRVAKTPHAVLSRASHSAAMRPWPTTHSKITNPLPTHNFINNRFTPSAATKWIDVADPATNNTVTRVPESTDDELAAAVASAEAAFPGWKNTSIMRRQQIMFNYVRLIRENWDRLAASITLEQGKTLEDARGDVLRGLQVAETACGITTQIPGQVLEVAKDMETRNYREPLGVVAAICPFSRCTAFSQQCHYSNLSLSRLPRHDPALVHPHCNNHRKHPDHQTV